MDKAIIYQMLPRLWGNARGANVKRGSLEENGSGRFSTIDEASLKYLKDMGITHVWYTGILRHATCEGTHGCKASSPQWVKGAAGSPYSISDWFDVNPYLADNPEDRMAEFEELIRRTHEAGLEVIIDYIPNHVSRDYGAFSPRPLKNGRDAAGHPVFGAMDNTDVHWLPDNDFFYYPGEELKLPVPPPPRRKPYSEIPARASGNSYSSCPSINDWFDTIKLNYCDYQTPTWLKMLEVLRFWAGKGVDGFRCDMVELVPAEFMKWLISSVKSEFPETLFIAEVYQKHQYAQYIHEVGFDLLYDKSGLYDVLSDIIRKNADDSGVPVEPWQSCARITWNWQETGSLSGHLLNFLENHDEQRLACDFFAQEGEHALAALAVSALFNTSSFMIYFGQEVGERGMDSEGMSGVDGRTSIFDWWSVGSLSRLYRHIHGEKALTPSEERLLGRYRKLLSLASGKTVAKGQTYDLGYCNTSSPGFNKDRHFAFLRSFGGRTILVVSNFSSVESEIQIQIPEHAFQWMKLSKSAMLNPEMPVRVLVPAYDFVIADL